MVGLTILLVVCIIFSGYFSATETAYTSLSKIKLKNMMQKKNKKNKRAELVYKQESNYDRVLSTILVGNNIVNIGAATIGTMLFTAALSDPNLGATVSTIVLTIIILIFGEVMPKSIAKEYPESFAMFSAPLLNVFIYLFMPLTYFFHVLKKLARKIMKANGEDRTITEDELITIVEESENGGVLDEHESELIRSAIEFNDLEVVEILTPRVDMVAIDINTPLVEITKIFRESGFSRLPVYKDTIDNIIGFIHEKDLYLMLFNKQTDLNLIVQKIICTTPTIKISSLLRELQLEKCHIAIVLDEYGGTKGMVTMEDILEELVGEIWDEHDEKVEELVDNHDGTYTVLASTTIEDLFEFFEVDYDHDDFTSVSVNGWISEMLDKMPEVNDEFDFENINVKVKELEMDGRRVYSILVKKIEKKEEEEPKKESLLEELKKDKEESSEEKE